MAVYYRPFQPTDLFNFTLANMDAMTETYNVGFYFNYLLNHGDYFIAAVNHRGDIVGYIMGKSEGTGENFHGHVTAVTVAANYRRMGIARKLMGMLEEASERKDCYYVDLFVRVSNTVAINMYKKMGYTVYREIIGYYNEPNPENAYDMRKALKRDTEKKSIIPIEKPVPSSEVE